jgi:glutathione-independent formaldehyde dehydrogenase
VRAVVLTGEREVSIETVADAELEAPTDALLRITSRAIYGTDLHFYERRMGAEPGMADAGHQSATQITRPAWSSSARLRRPARHP